MGSQPRARPQRTRTAAAWQRVALGKSLSLSRLYSLICITGLRAIELAAPTSFLTP